MGGDICALVELDTASLVEVFDFKVLGCGAFLLAALGPCYCDYFGTSGYPGRLSVTVVNQVCICVGSQVDLHGGRCDSRCYGGCFGWVDIFAAKICAWYAEFLQSVEDFIVFCANSGLLGCYCWFGDSDSEYAGCGYEDEFEGEHDGGLLGGLGEDCLFAMPMAELIIYIYHIVKWCKLHAIQGA